MEIIEVRHFKDLTLDQLYGILRVRAEVFVTGQKCLYVDPDGKDMGAVQVFASEGGRLTGCLRIYHKEKDVLQIGRVAVLENYRGHGLGFRLMRKAIDYIIESCIETKIYLEAQTYAIGFYEKLGFEVVSDEFLDEGIPHKGMELLIERASGPSGKTLSTGKNRQYEMVRRQIESLLEGEPDIIAGLANAAAILHAAFGFWWTGFYLVKGDTLVLGPFQGPLACSRIPFGKGVCGTAWERKESVVVPDVEMFPGHIACSSLSRSEIVVPLFNGDDVVAVLDIDSKELGTFDDTDRVWLEKIAALLAILPWKRIRND